MILSFVEIVARHLTIYTGMLVAVLMIFTIFSFTGVAVLNVSYLSTSNSMDTIGYSGSFGQSFRKVSDTLFAPVQVKLV